jgi:hypothetical protein
MNTVVRIGAILLATTGFVFGDVSYQETVKYTGGSLVDMMKGMQGGLMGKMMGGRMGKALQDQTFKVYVKGNKMARIGPDTATIFDLDAGTMTTIDNQKQAYSTMTFEEMNQRIEEMKQKMSKSGSQGADIQFDVKVDDTGNTKSIDGQTAKEYVMTLTAQGQQGAGMRVRSEMWDLSSVPGLDELREFQKHMSEKLAGGSAGFNPMLGSASSGLSQLNKEVLKIKGFPVSQDVAITGVQSPMNPMMAMRGSGEGGDPNAPFLTMNTASASFSDSAISDSVFEIPAGYKQQHAGRH